MILADTSGLLALLDAGEPSHARVRQSVERDGGPLLTIDLVLAETAFLIQSRLGALAELAFLEQVLGGAVLREPLGRADLARAREILTQYADQSFGLTDAALMAVAERLRSPVLTLDRRHFGVFRDRDGAPLELVP